MVFRPFCLVLLATELVWLGLVLFVPQSLQTKVWYLAGQEYLSDYFMTRVTASHENPYREPAHTLAYSFLRGGKIVESEGWDLEERDRAYPAGALLPLLPFEESLSGAHRCNAVMIGTFIAVLLLCLWRLPLGASPMARLALVIPLALSGPFLFACERGNSIWLAAAGTMLFLFCWDHPRRSVRWLAAAALAVAASIKVMPALLGVLYLAPVVRQAREKGWAGILPALVDPAVCAVLGLAAFFVPWFFVCGFGTFPDWWRTGHANVAWYAPLTMFGFVNVCRTVMLTFHQGWEASAMFEVARWLTVALGVAALAVSVRRLRHSRYAAVLLATAGILLVGANMRQYTVLYLVPAFLLWLAERRRRTAEAFAWFVVWTPLQIPFGPHQLYLAVNLALLFLVCTAIWYNSHSENLQEESACSSS